MAITIAFDKGSTDSGAPDRRLANDPLSYIIVTKYIAATNEAKGNFPAWLQETGAVRIKSAGSGCLPERFLFRHNSYLQ